MRGHVHGTAMARLGFDGGRSKTRPYGQRGSGSCRTKEKGGDTVAKRGNRGAVDGGGLTGGLVEVRREGRERRTALAGAWVRAVSVTGEGRRRAGWAGVLGCAAGVMRAVQDGRVRKGWLGRRFSRPRQLCGLGQAGVG